MFGLGGQEVLIIVLVLAGLFGINKIPTLLGNLGRGITEFKKGLKGADEEVNAIKENFSSIGNDVKREVAELNKEIKEATKV